MFKLGLAIATKTVIVGGACLLTGAGLTAAITKWQSSVREKAMAAGAGARIVTPR